MKLDPFEYRIFRELSSSIDLTGARLLIACSGGLDSVALVAAMNKIAPKLDFKIALATVHHGETHRPELTDFRAAAVESVRSQARSLRIDFFSARYRGRGSLRSEADFRNFRIRALEKLRAAHGFTHVVFAHHADDLFETRVMRLIRGTGPGGWQSMNLAGPKILRPFLFAKRSEILAYAQRQTLSWIEDPSNTETQFFRNWLRLDWLPALEAKRPGSRKSFARSLEVMAESAPPLTAHETTQTIDRLAFTQSDLRARRQMIANCLRSLRTNFGRAHVEEIRKRLEVSTKTLEFDLLGLRWKINAEQIEALRAGRDQDVIEDFANGARS